MAKRGLDSIQKEEVEQIQHSDPRFKKLVNSEAAPKQIEEPSDAKLVVNQKTKLNKVKPKAQQNHKDYEYIVASNNK